jgi:hypothetical protein
MADHVFISYSTEDAKVTKAIRSILESEGIPCWIAPRDVPIGKTWAEAIIGAIDSSRIFVLVLSSNSNSSTQVIREVGMAASRNLPIITLRIDDTPPSGAMEYFIGTQHWLDAQEPPLEKHLQRLVNTVKTLLTQQYTAPSTAVLPKERKKPPAAVEIPARLTRRIAKSRWLWAGVSLLFLVVVVSVVVVMLTQESVPILTEPILTNIEVPTIGSTYASGTLPKVDGLLSPDEWPQPAFTKTLQYALKDNKKTGEMKGYIMNDSNYLYVAIQFTGEGFEEGILKKEGVFLTPAIWFDGDSDGVISLDEDVGRFWESYYVDSHVGAEGWEKSDDHRDGLGACTFSDESVTYTYEYQIPLNSGDPQDLATYPGEIIGIKVILGERQYISPNDSTTLGTTGWPTGAGCLDASTYAKLVLAMEGTTPVEESTTPVIPLQNLWEDDFSNASSGWPTREMDSYWSSGYQRSHYYVLIKGPKLAVPFTTSEALGEYSDFVIAADCWLEPSDSAGDYGLVFRYSENPLRGYEFIVHADGRFHIGRKSADQQYSLLVDYEESPFIKMGGQINRLMIECQGSQIDAYINGTLVASLVDDSPREGLVGLFACSSEASNVRVLFDNFYLSW